MKKLLVLAPLLFLPLYANSVSKADWADKMSEQMPSIMCQSNQYFRTCYNVSEQTCQSVASSAISTCLSQNDSKVPNILNEQNGRQWSSTIGQCAATKFDSQLKNKRNTNNKQCYK